MLRIEGWGTKYSISHKLGDPSSFPYQLLSPLVFLFFLFFFRIKVVCQEKGIRRLHNISELYFETTKSCNVHIQFGTERIMS